MNSVDERFLVKFEMGKVKDSLTIFLGLFLLDEFFRLDEFLAGRLK